MDDTIDLTATRANLDRLRRDAIEESRIEIEAMHAKARGEFPDVGTSSADDGIEHLLPQMVGGAILAERHRAARTYTFIMPDAPPADTWDLMERTDGEPVEIRTGLSRAEADLALADAIREYGRTVHFYLRRRTA